MRFSLPFVAASLAVSFPAVLATTFPVNPRKVIELQSRETSGEVTSIPGVNGFRVRTTKKVDLEALGNDIKSTLGGNHPWSDHGKCRTRVSSQGGAKCYNAMLGPTIKGQSGVKIVHSPTENPWNVCPWSGTDPPTQYFNHVNVGYYSLQFTATDSKVWDGISDTIACPKEGLCNPRITIFREDFDLIIDAWVASSAPEGALCESFIIPHLGGGAELGHDCVVPCTDQITLHQLD